jgi:hypothetical protein
MKITKLELKNLIKSTLIEEGFMNKLKSGVGKAKAIGGATLKLAKLEKALKKDKELQSLITEHGQDSEEVTSYLESSKAMVEFQATTDELADALERIQKEEDDKESAEYNAKQDAKRQNEADVNTEANEFIKANLDRLQDTWKSHVEFTKLDAKAKGMKARSPKRIATQKEADELNQQLIIKKTEAAKFLKESDLSPEALDVIASKFKMRSILRKLGA